MNSKIKIYFIENSYDYNASDLNSSKIAGSEKTLINITNELAKDKNLIIKVFNNTSAPFSKINNVYWDNINKIDNDDKPDFVVAMSDANLLNNLNCKKNFLWSHSIQSFEKFIRKKQLLPFLRYKPKMILEGEYHFNQRSFLTSFYGKKILKIAPDYDFIYTKIENNYIPPPNAIFTTKSDRNLKFLINSWHEINKRNSKTNLYINPPYKLSEIDKTTGVHLRNKGDKKKLILDLINSRLFLTPGHKTEVFCLAAEEARELCIPIVTMGYGCLYERVEHGVTGFIAKNRSEFINYAYEILTNDKTYLDLKRNLIEMKNSRNYSHVRNDFLNILNNE